MRAVERTKRRRPERIEWVTDLAEIPAKDGVYEYDRRAALATDRVALAGEVDEKEGPARSNLRSGYVLKAPA